MSKKFYITTAIPYVNARPHIGFALELVQADAIARYHRQRGDDVYFLTGTDDNALKNVHAAEKTGTTTKEFVDTNAALFQELAKKLNISNDQFIRTTSKEHFAGAQKLWQSCTSADIYKKKYKGLYCVGCEQFYSEQELVNGACPEHKTIPEKVEEENYFFKLSNYQEKLETLIASDTYRIVPESRKNEVLSFIRSGLEDFSISRSIERAKGWGVPVPGDDSQIMYVWFDALSNYFTALGYANEGELYHTYWPADVHVIGKGVIRFHAVYWPAMLLSAGIPLPKTLFVHGYITVGGTKMSKSLGNVIDPFHVIRTYGTDAVRLYLLKHIHPFEDGDFREEKFIESYNADLAHGLGNLLSRVTTMVENYLDGTTDKALGTSALHAVIEHCMNEYSFKGAMEAIWSEIRDCDLFIDKQKPWGLAKKDATKLRSVLSDLVYRIYNIGVALEPFLPETSKTVVAAVSADRVVKAKPLFGTIEV